MALLTIAGVDQSAYVADWAPFSTQKTFNNRSTARFTLNPGLIPARLAEVVTFKADGTTPDFGGIIVTRSVRGVVDVHVRSVVDITCGDFLTYGDYCVTTREYTTQVAPEDVIDDLVTDHLGAYGITYTPAASGILLEPFEWSRTRLTDALRSISERTGLIFKVSPTKVLTMEAPGATSTPWSLTDANLPAMSLNWEDDSRMPANRIVVVAGSGTRQTVEAFVADGVNYGGQTHYYTEYRALEEYHGYWPNQIVVGGVPLPVGWYALHPSWEWSWDPTGPLGRLTHNDTDYGITPAATAITSVGYTRLYPFEEEAVTGATPVVTITVERPDIMERADAALVAAKLLAAEGGIPRVTSVLTLDGDGFEPGQEFPFNLTTLRGGIVDDFLVKGVTMRHERNVRKYQIDVSSPDVLSDTMDRWRALLGGRRTSSVGSSAGPGVGGGTAPFPPDGSVQFNDGGTFGGSDQVVLDPDKTRDTYDGDEAALAVLPPDDTRWAQVWRNQSAPAGAMLGLVMEDFGDCLLYSYGNDWYLINNNRDISIQAARVMALAGPSGVEMHVGGNVDTAAIEAFALISAYGMALRTTRVTGTSVTVDTSPTSAITTFIFDPSAACTMNLPALSSFRVTPATDQQRILWAVNDSPTYTVTIDPNSSESIFVGGVAQSTLVLYPGQAVCLGAWNGTDAGWKVLSSHGGVAGGIQVATITLTDAQIKALPTTPITLVVAPPTGHRIVWAEASIQINCIAGAYTNINADSYWVLRFGSAEVSQYIANQTGDYTYLSDLLTGADKNSVQLRQWLRSEVDVTDLWGPLPTVAGDVFAATALQLYASNSGSGDYTGGNAGNSGVVSVTYRIEPTV